MRHSVSDFNSTLDDRDLYVEFLKRGTGPDYDRVMQILKGEGETAYEPSDVPI
jgi:hypothetical protein